MSGAGDDVMIGIPRHTYELLQRKILGTSYESVQDYVKAVLEQLSGEGASRDDKQGLSAEDEHKIKERLKDLGYM